MAPFGYYSERSVCLSNGAVGEMFADSWLPQKPGRLVFAVQNAVEAHHEVQQSCNGHFSEC